MTASRAKKLLGNYLESLESEGLTYNKLTARTVGFSDLARGDRVFVRIHGWKPCPRYDDVRRFAVEHGFSVEAY